MRISEYHRSVQMANRMLTISYCLALTTKKFFFKFIIIIYYYYYYYLLLYCFHRKDFAHISEVRSILAESVHLMALTATATTDTRKFIIETSAWGSPLLYMFLQ